jgi:filamentous hemagglutinin family protein
MRRLLLLPATCLALGGPQARAETYQILEGTLSWHEVGRNAPLSGSFDAFPAAAGASADLTPLLVGGFALQVGERSFTPSPPVEFDGLTPILFVEIADQINLQGDAVGLVHLRSGGELVGASGEQVTFRFLDFRSGPSGGGHAVGRLVDGVLPRRLELEGTLYEIDQTFQIERGPCAVPPVPEAPPGGGGVVIGAGGVVVQYESFEIVGETVELVQPGAGGVPSRVTGGGSSIGGELHAGGEVSFVNPAGVQFGSVSAGAAPSLEALGITAPDGASVSYADATGELAVTSEGDLFVEGSAIDLPGLTRLSLRTPGSITLTGALTLPAGASLLIEAGAVVVEGEIVAPGGVVVNPPEITPVPFCAGLRPLFGGPVARPVGVFSLVASAARQIEIDVQPGRRHNRVLPGRRQWLDVAILGSGDFDVRDIDESSLRLGPGEAEPSTQHGRRPTRRGHANRDRQLDLLARFDLRDTGIAYGDDELCLVAETLDGETLEGCDAIQTLPSWLRAARRGAPRHAHGR